jgi:positive regulator of sigma E activity
MYIVDVLFMILYSLLKYIFIHDVWYVMSLMHGQVQGSS